MLSLPVDWIARALSALAVPEDTATQAIMRAWRQSTPLPEYVFNPIGMPAGSRGAPAYLTTQYAVFPGFTAFLIALASFADTYTGQSLSREMTGDPPYASAWRAIHALNWPGNRTETDYPAVLLDLTTQAYRDSVSAASPADRKTAGMIMPRNAVSIPSSESSGAIAPMGRSVAGAIKFTQPKMRG